MGRRRAERPVPLEATSGPLGSRAAGRGAGLAAARRRPEPVGAARVPWSYLAALPAAALTGLVGTIADPLSNAFCAPEDAACSLGFLVASSILAGVATSGLVAWLMGLGWEWWLICATAVVALPGLLDLLDWGGWVLLALTPAIAALATLTGRLGRPVWRPAVIGGACTLVIAWSLLTTFVL